MLETKSFIFSKMYYILYIIYYILYIIYYYLCAYFQEVLIEIFTLSKKIKFKDTDDFSTR